MKNVSIRLPHYEELERDSKSLVAMRIDNIKGTDLSKQFDRDELGGSIMIIRDDHDRKEKTNYSYVNTSESKGVFIGTPSWYEYILPIIKLSEEDFNNIIENIDEDGMVELGSFPSTRVEDQTIIDSIKNQVKEYTGNSYTLPISSHYFGRKSTDSKQENKWRTTKTRVVDTKKFKEYEINGERYITYEEKDSNEKNIYKVEPLRWYVNTETRELVCSTLPVNGIIYNPHPRKPYLFNPKLSYTDIRISYNESQVRKYLENNFIKEAILDQIPKRVLFEAKQEDTLTALINEISVYAEYYHGTEDVNQVIKDLINKYNKDIDALETSSGLQVYTEEGLHLKLISDLSRILDKIKRNAESSKEYYDLLKYIDSLIDILDGRQTETDNELLKDIQKISTEVLPKISSDSKKQEEFKQRIFEELRSDRDKVKSYLEYMNTLSKDINLRIPKDIGFKTIKEYESNFRMRLHPILESIRNTSLEEEKLALIDSKNKQLKELSNGKLDKDLVNFELYRILESLYRNDFQENKTINILLNEINSLVNELRSYNIKPEPAFSINIQSDNIEDIVKKLNVIIINLHKMILTAKESNEKHMRLSKYKISI